MQQARVFVRWEKDTQREHDYDGDTNTLAYLRRKKDYLLSVSIITVMGVDGYTRGAYRSMGLPSRN